MPDGLRGSNANPETSFYTLVNGKEKIGKFAGVRMRAARQRQKFYELQELKRSGLKTKSSKPTAKKLPEKERHAPTVPVVSAA